MVVGEVGSGHWEHKGRPLWTEQRGGRPVRTREAVMAQLTLSDISNSQRLQSSTEKAAT